MIFGQLSLSSQKFKPNYFRKWWPSFEYFVKFESVETDKSCKQMKHQNCSGLWVLHITFKSSICEFVFNPSCFCVSNLSVLTFVIIEKRVLQFWQRVAWKVVKSANYRQLDATILKNKKDHRNKRVYYN